MQAHTLGPLRKIFYIKPEVYNKLREIAMEKRISIDDCAEEFLREHFMPQPQLPKTISTAEEEEEKIKSKPRIKMVTKKDSDIEVTSDEELPAMSSSSSLSSDAATESPSTEIPSTEIYSTKREGKEGTTIEKRKLANEKKE